MTAQNQQRDYITVLLDSFIPQKCLFRLTPLHREPFGILPKKAGLQTFLHSQAPSHPNGQWRDLASTKPNVFVLCRAQTLSSEAQWRLCLGAITEFTAAGQSEIHTPVPN